MRGLFFIILIAGAIAVRAQTSDSSAPSKAQPTNSKSSSQSKSAENPKLAPPRSDRVDATSLGDQPGDSSSKDTQIDLSPPPDDAKAHPRSSEILTDEGSSAGGDTMEFHLWDPHKAAKDVEVGDYYFKRKNYVAAESRYREALYYKDNDALATFRLGISLEKLDRPGEARSQFESYLKILPHGPQAEEARQGIERLKKAESPSAKAAK